MDGSTRAYSRGAKKVPAANKCDLMVACTRAISKATSFMVVASLQTQRAMPATRVSGRMARCMVKAFIFGRMAVATRASTSSIKKKVLAFTCGLMDAPITACGGTAYKMAKALKFSPILK